MGRFFMGEPSMGAQLQVRLPLRAGHSDQSGVQLREGDRMCEASVGVAGTGGSDDCAPCADQHFDAQKNLRIF